MRKLVLQTAWKWLPFCLSLVGFIGILLGAENTVSSQFAKCLSQISPHDVTATTGQKLLHIVWPQSVCTLRIVDAHNGFFGLLVAVVVAAFTFTLRRTSIEQGKLTRRSIDIAEQSMTIGQWPFLYIKDQRFMTPFSRPSASHCPQFEFSVLMYGQSPAIIRATSLALFFDTQIPRDAMRGRGWRWTSGVMHPTESTQLSISWEGPEIIATVQDRAKARAAGKWFYAVGRIVYDDLFGNQHEFGFCYQGAIGGGWGARAGGRTYNYGRLRTEEERAEIDLLETPRPNEPPEPTPPLVGGVDFPI
jgi:hypothetical protein